MTSASRHASQPALTFCEAFVCRAAAGKSGSGTLSGNPSKPYLIRTVSLSETKGGLNG
jgi:hypothetical protein